MDILTSNLSTKTPVDVVFLDFAKAFDKVPHRRLISKLLNYGISGKLLTWIESFLSNRRQRVVLGDTVSDWSAVTSSVPQGSVLGPTLFILYINDLVDIIKNRSILYADDTKIICPVASAEERDMLQGDINNIVDWTNTWLMRLNIDKCKVMHIGRNNQNYQYTMNDYITSLPTPLETTKSEKDLGIILTDDLKANKQCIAAAAKANHQLGLLKKAFVSRDKFLWKKLYVAYVRPHLEYAVAAWNPHCKKDIKLLEKVQRRATKIAPELRHLSYLERCTILDLSTLSKRRVRGDLIQQFKLIHRLDKVNWYMKPIVREQRANRSRLGINRGLLTREIVKNCKERFNFFNNRIPKFWNLLSDQLINSISINSFKAGLDKFLPSFKDLE